MLTKATARQEDANNSYISLCDKHLVHEQMHVSFCAAVVVVVIVQRKLFSSYEVFKCNYFSGLRSKKSSNYVIVQRNCTVLNKSLRPVFRLKTATQLTWNHKGVSLRVRDGQKRRFAFHRLQISSRFHDIYLPVSRQLKSSLQYFLCYQGSAAMG